MLLTSYINPYNIAPNRKQQYQPLKSGSRAEGNANHHADPSPKQPSVIRKLLSPLVDSCIPLFIMHQRAFKILVFVISIIYVFVQYQASIISPIFKVQSRTESENNVINHLRLQVLKRLERKQVQRDNRTIVQFGRLALSYVEQPYEYIQIDKYENNWKQLPICAVMEIGSRLSDEQTASIQSVIKQNYTNYQLLLLSSQQSFEVPQHISKGSPARIQSIHFPFPHNYASFNAIIQQKCQLYGIVVIINGNKVDENQFDNSFENQNQKQINKQKQRKRQILKPQAFQKINQIYQHYNIWTIFQHNPNIQQNPQQRISVVSFLQRIFRLIGDNDFKKDNQNYLNKQFDRQYENLLGYLTMALLELSAQHAYNMYDRLDQIADNGSVAFQLALYFNKDVNRLFNPLDSTRVQVFVQRTPYQPLDGLNQDFWVDLPALNNNFFNFLKDDFYNYDRQREKKQSQFANIPRILKAKQYQQLLYLPLNHSLSIRQIIQVGSEYSSAQNKDQNPLCITILSRNNIQNNRYLRVLQSILQQNYSNYHIVFMDDVSTDANMAKTVEYIRLRNQTERGIFDLKGKIKATFVQNRVRKYGTYNIVHAAFRYCQETDIQVLVDGDDELIGRQPFRIIDNAYKAMPNKWVIYTNYRNSHYVYGDSGPYYQYNDLHTPYLNIRKYGHMLSPIRTWKVPIIRSIPLQAHKVYSQWFDTGYDDALQYPLFQHAGPDRIHYIKQILYTANKEYGDNDDSNEVKVQHRADVIFTMLKYQPYQRLKQLKKEKDPDVWENFQSDRKKGDFQSFN